MSRWTEDMGEDRLWVCQVCGSECDSDSVGEKCPECGAPAEDRMAACVEHDWRYTKWETMESPTSAYRWKRSMLCDRCGENRMVFAPHFEKPLDV